MAWTAADVPDQSGRTIVITGGNSGLGLESAKVLAGKGAQVVLACRSLDKAGEAIAEITREHPAAKLEARQLDLASLASVEGFEMQLGTNHFGPFALTGLVLDRVLAAPAGRIVTVSSQFHRRGKINFDDLSAKRRYAKWGAYGQSKLANLLFAFELQRRFEAAGAKAISVAAHPGYASTNLQTAGPRMEGSSFLERMSEFGNTLFAQSAAAGALPQLYAATDPGVRGGEYFGPDGLYEMRGSPKKVGTIRAARDAECARRLWKVSEEATGVCWEALEGARP
jgi:NAD(P)-dependent dehydrogenase (short-subunit alcohol dehydrogenase family)